MINSNKEFEKYKHKFNTLFRKVLKDEYISMSELWTDIIDTGYEKSVFPANVTTTKEGATIFVEQFWCHNFNIKDQVLDKLNEKFNANIDFPTVYELYQDIKSYKKTPKKKKTNNTIPEDIATKIRVLLGWEKNPIIQDLFFCKTADNNQQPCEAQWRPLYIIAELQRNLISIHETHRTIKKLNSFFKHAITVKEKIQQFKNGELDEVSGLKKSLQQIKDWLDKYEQHYLENLKSKDLDTLEIEEKLSHFLWLRLYGERPVDEENPDFNLMKSIGEMRKNVQDILKEGNNENEEILRRLEKNEKFSISLDCFIELYEENGERILWHLNDILRIRSKETYECVKGCFSKFDKNNMQNNYKFTNENNFPHLKYESFRIWKKGDNN